MGLLTSSQIAAIPSGRVAHKYQIYCKGYATWTGATVHTLHDDTASPPVIAVTSHGQRANSVGNISPKSFGSVETMRHEITINNSDGKAYREGSLDSDRLFYAVGSSSRMVHPQEARIKHSTYVMVSGSWSELPCSPWWGQIEDVIYDDTGESATIIAECLAAVKLREPWNVDHAYTTVIDDAYSPSGFRIGDVSTGVDSSGDVWCQLTASVSVYYEMNIKYYPFVDSNWFSGGPSATVQVEDTSPPSSWKWCFFYVTLWNGAQEQTFQHNDVHPVRRDQTAVARPW